MVSKPGKWAWLKGKYPRLNIDAKLNEMIDAILNSPASGMEGDALLVRDLNNRDVADRYTAVREKIDTLNAEIGALNTEKAAYERIFGDRFEEDDVSVVKFDDGLSISASIKPSAVVRLEEKSDFIDWAIKEHPEWLSVSFNTLNAIVKEAIENGTTLPPHVDVFLANSFRCSGRQGTASAKKKGEPVTAENYEQPACVVLPNDQF